MEAVDEAGSRRGGDFDAEGACGDATVGGDGDGGAEAPDVGPPRAFGCGAQGGAAFFLRGLPGTQRGHGQFAVALVGVAMAAEVGEEEVGGWDVGERVGGEERGDAVLPVLVAAFDFALGLRSGRVAKGDVVKMERGAELGEGVGDGGEEEGMAIDVEAQREAVFKEGAREEVEVGGEIFGGIDACADAAAAAIIEHVEEREQRAFGPPAVRSGVELPERADLAALPAADGGARFGRGLFGGEAIGERETADGGRIELEIEAAFDLAGGGAVAGRRAG